MAVLRDLILKEAAGEAIEGVVIGDVGALSHDDVDEFADDDEDELPLRLPSGEVIPKHSLVEWSDAEQVLSYVFNLGFGARRCHAITAWCATKVIFLSTYDGSITIRSVPRHPVAHRPVMFGG